MSKSFVFQKIMKKKVLHFITGLEKGGGAEKMILNTIPYLKKTENRVCAVKGKGEIGKELEKKGVKVYYLEMNGWMDLGVIKRYKKVISDFEPNMQINYLIHADVFGRIFAKNFGVNKLVSFIRNNYKNGLHKFLDKITINRSDYLLTNSEYVLYQYIKKYSYLQGISGCIPNGVEIKNNIADDGKLKLLSKELNLSENDFVFTCVARLHPQKNHLTLIKAVKLLKERGKKNIKVLLCGDGVERDNLKRIIKELEVENHVIFLGTRSDVVNVLQISDVFVLPSLHEGMSNALLEAMAYSVPAIVSSIPENKELISHNENGLVFNVGDAESLAENMLIAIADPKKMNELSEKSRELIENKYDIKKVIDKLDSFLFEEI